MERTLPTIESCTFLLLVVVVARRYELKIDPHTKQCRSKTRSCFRSGLSLAGREVRTLFPMVVQTGKLPSPLHQLFLSFCHIVSVLYGTKHMPPCVWSTRGKVHVYLTLLITEMYEGGSTCTLYAHGMTHFFHYPRLPVHVQDEAGEAWLAVAKSFAGVTSTENSEIIRETLQHEHYVQFLKRVKKRNRVEHWHPEVRAILLQPCTAMATECWRDMPVRIVQCGVVTGGYFCAMDVATKSVKLGFLGSTQPNVDIYCIRGLCSTQLPLWRHWIPINWDVVVSWPVLGLGSLRTFSSRKDRRHKEKQPRPAVVEAAGSDYAPPDTCEGLPARRVMPVRQLRGPASYVGP